MLKLTGRGRTAATNAASASAAKFGGVEALRCPDGVDECFGCALHVHALKSLPALFDVGLLPWQQPPGEVKPELLSGWDVAQCGQSSPLE
jgi:hypothetical protein